MSAERVIRVAALELGYTETPPNSNRTKYGLAYGLDGYPWCAIFLWWCFREAGEARAFYGGGKTASCGALMRYYQARSRWFQSGYQVGDIVILNFSGTQDTEHCGLVTEAHPDGSVTTIEGNTTPGLEGSQDNGGSVARKRRYPRNIVGACRPEYAAPTDYDGHWAAEGVRWAMENGLMQGYPDGLFHPDDPATRAQLAEVLTAITEDSEDKMKDWMNRALKTFVQAFFGVLLPELAAMMKEGFPETGSALRVTLPMVAAALAAAISAVWNLWLEAARKKGGQ